MGRKGRSSICTAGGPPLPPSLHCCLGPFPAARRGLTAHGCRVPAALCRSADMGCLQQRRATRQRWQVHPGLRRPQGSRCGCAKGVATRPGGDGLGCGACARRRPACCIEATHSALQDITYTGGSDRGLCDSMKGQGLCVLLWPFACTTCVAEVRLEGVAVRCALQEGPPVPSYAAAWARSLQQGEA